MITRRMKTAVFKYPDSPRAPGRVSSCPPTGELHQKVLCGPHNAASPSESQHHADSAALLWNPLKWRRRVEAHSQTLLLFLGQKCQAKRNSPLKYGVKACLCSVLKKHFSQSTAISERMASVTLRMLSSLSSSRRWTSERNWKNKETE